jgi:hypothetical protein
MPEAVQQVRAGIVLFHLVPQLLWAVLVVVAMVDSPI